MARRTLVPAPVRGWVLASVGAAALFLLPLPAWVVEEFYARDFYPWLQLGVTTVSNLIPLALIDVFLAAAATAVLIRFVLLVRVGWQNGVSRALAEFARRVVRFAGVLGLLFLSMWGCNYRRMPIERTLGDRVVTTPTIVGLQEAVADSNALAASLRPAVLAGPELSYAEIGERLKGPMNTALQQVNRGPLGRPGRPKFSLILTPFFTWAGVNGMIDPLALESVVHPDLLPFERPFVLAHEWAHLAGQADEAEASAVGWLACMNGEAPLAYSASLYLILEAAGALPADARRQAVSRLDAGVRSDLDAMARRARLEKPQVRATASRVYDRYLRANRVSDGNASYGRAVTLILSPPFRDALDSYGRAK